MRLNIKMSVVSGRIGWNTKLDARKKGSGVNRAVKKG